MRFVKRHWLTAYALLAVAYLMLPIAVVIMFSFNQPAGRFNYVWNEFTFDNWVNWDSVLGLRESVVTSLEIALATSLLSIVIHWPGRMFSTFRPNRGTPVSPTWSIGRRRSSRLIAT